MLLSPFALDCLMLVFCIVVGLRFFAPKFAPEAFDALMGALVALMSLVLFLSAVMR